MSFPTIGLGLAARRSAVLTVLSAAAFAQTAPSPAPIPATPAQQSQTAAPPPKKSSVPSVIEGGGVSFEARYWLGPAKPQLRAGRGFGGPDSGDLDFASKVKGGPGGMLSLPAGRGNSLRISWHRMKAPGTGTAPRALNLFGTGYATGDALSTQSTMTNVKVSWDYLTYTFGSGIRLKTLWEAQYASVKAIVDAPIKARNALLAGNSIETVAEGQRWVALPTLGLGLQQGNKNIRWELKASGMRLRTTIWDAEALVAVRAGHFEFQVGGRGFHLKTSPRDDYYYKQTVFGPFAGVRYYLDKGK